MQLAMSGNSLTCGDKPAQRSGAVRAKQKRLSSRHRWCYARDPNQRAREPNLQKHQSGGWLYSAFSTGNPWPLADRGLLKPRRGAFAKFDIDLMQIACFICAAFEVKALRSDNYIIPSDDNQHWRHIYIFTHERDS